jgi:hypothetical protein
MLPRFRCPVRSRPDPRHRIILAHLDYAPGSLGPAPNAPRGSRPGNRGRDRFAQQPALVREQGIFEADKAMYDALTAAPGGPVLNPVHLWERDYLV